ncbi:hypothetical protein FN846DRAFT_238449 [Sphaerosporella brunnea]|uniref:tRNA/rRNA methyltransferase SpoU type domain-containing protein n=1 Tax=Sphaerosporella brunnea TaxID=1250544 RepID=A0A5J5FCJ8_9PEZI|nr:hypothetical protein FN846DRAFT_238449 [Sphaerosporella brunnea]
MRFLENESLLGVLRVIRSIASRYPQQLHECQKIHKVGIDSLVSQLWETVEAATLRSDYTKAYHGFIKTIFHPTILAYAVDNQDLQDALLRVATEIMKLGAGKRSIRPAIAKAIWKAFLKSPDNPRIICHSAWLIDLIIELIDHQQADSDKDFTVGHSLAVIFDEVEPGTDHYKEYYGDLEIFSQVYMFDMLARMDAKDPTQVEFVKVLRERLFAPWTENFPGISIWTAWKKHMQLQTLVLLERFVSPDEAEEFLGRVINKALCWEPHPRFRFLFEWITSLCILRYPEHRNCLWRHLQNPEEQNPKLQVSLLRVGLMVARALPDSLREEYFTELVYTAVPLTSNSKVVVRHQAISMALEFWEDADRFSLTNLTSNPLFQRIHEASTNSSYYKEFKNAKDFRTFDGVRNFTMVGIFSGHYLRGGDEIEIIPEDAFAGLEDFSGEDSRRRWIPLGAPVDAAEAATEQAVTGLHSGKVNYNPHDAARLAVLSSSSALPPLQTKGSDIPIATTNDEELEIILCASLLDNGFNLGGVSRVSEIMGVKTLTLASKAVVKTSEFSSVSVHSESWLDIQEVPIPEIAEYLRGKRSEGYTAVGLEQTDRSIILGKGEWKFPKKTVLLLGTEKFGIPAELLGELDWCVEIPQKGKTRSMNVQTAAAVVLYEACRQARGM